jgi:uncharacterized membrane protein (UPF0127 family)
MKSVVLFLAILISALTARAQEPQIPYAAPRLADTLVMLPDGSTVHVELAKTETEQAYGLMGRTALPQGRGMLFIHNQAGQYPYWMYHCKIGLDIIWMDQSRRIAEISPNTPPCKGKAATCPNYGGHATSLYVLELPVGSVKAHDLKEGQVVNFNLQ